jgi:hypothetical protein
MACTLVTCYYPLKSKYPSEQYLRWASDFLKLDASIVLFTTPELAGLFKEIRSKAHPVNDHYSFHLVEQRFEDLDAWVYKTQWIQHHGMDPERDNHSPELYAIWAQKAFFVKRAIDLNPFGTNYFLWCDIGAFRNGLDPVIQTSFPSVRHLPADRILMSSVGPSLPGDNTVRSDGIRGDFMRVNRIVGGLWGGGSLGCIRWLHTYKDMLERYFAAGRFAGKDQSVMLSAYLEDRTSALIVKSTVPNIDIWFFLTHLCSNRAVQYELDASYI